MIGENNAISVKRLALDGESKEAYDSSFVFENEPCYIEPLDPTVATILDGQNAFTTFKIYLEGTLDVKIGDKCIDQQSVEYIVRGLQKYSNNPDTGDMTELTAVKQFPE